MTIVTTLYALRKRLKEKELEKCINILEEERRRRALVRDDDVLKVNRGERYV